MENVQIDEQVSITVDDGEIVMADSEIDSTSTFGSEEFGAFTRNGMLKLEDRDRHYNKIKAGFLMGMGAFRKYTNVVAIHGNNYSGNSIKQARSVMFQSFADAVANKCGGDPDLRNAWYGSSRDEICDIVSHGFRQCTQPKIGESYGFGVYLSPENFSINSALSSMKDENGLRHLLLCSVIMGKKEVLSGNWEQFQPRSKEFDSGVDNLSSPRRYIIWGAYMNAQIFPCYVISFEIVCSIGSQLILDDQISDLSNFVHPSKAVLIAKYHTDFKENKITSHELRLILNHIVRTDLLKAVANLWKDKRIEARTGPSVTANPGR